MKLCLRCLVGYTWDCREDPPCTEPVETSVELDDSTYDVATPKERGGQMKDAHSIKDATSTGRKRAAMIWPTSIMETMTCQWAGLLHAGGGTYPIVGCNPDSPGKATDRHHGPDKSVLNNSPTNLHVICKTCHNRWHTLNDEDYPLGRPGVAMWVPAVEFSQHDDVTKASVEEFAASEILWAKGNVRKALDSK